MTENNLTKVTTGRRRKREKSYVTIENTMFEEKRISFKAKGILGYLLTKPDGWVVRYSDLMNHSTDGEKALRSGIKELRENGYLRFYQTKKPNGKWGGLIWEYDDVPFFENEPLKPQLLELPSEDEIEVEIPINEPYAQNGYAVENVDMTEFSPHADFGDAVKRDAVKRDAEKGGNISKTNYTNTNFNNNLLKTTTKTRLEIHLVSSSSQEILSLDKIFQDQNPNIPYAEIKQKLFEDAQDGKVELATPSQFKGLMATRIQFYNQSKEVRKSIANENSPEPSETVTTSSEAVTEPSEQSQSPLNRSKGSSETKKAIEDTLTALVNHSGEKTPEEIEHAKAEIERMLNELRKEKK
jgi:hypothetical protein